MECADISRKKRKETRFTTRRCAIIPLTRKSTTILNIKKSNSQLSRCLQRKHLKRIRYIDRKYFSSDGNKSKVTVKTLFSSEKSRAIKKVSKRDRVNKSVHEFATDTDDGLHVDRSRHQHNTSECRSAESLHRKIKKESKYIKVYNMAGDNTYSPKAKAEKHKSNVLSSPRNSSSNMRTVHKKKNKYSYKLSKHTSESNFKVKRLKLKPLLSSASIRTYERKTKKYKLKHRLSMEVLKRLEQNCIYNNGDSPRQSYSHKFVDLDNIKCLKEITSLYLDNTVKNYSRNFQDNDNCNRSQCKSEREYCAAFFCNDVCVTGKKLTLWKKYDKHHSFASLQNKDSRYKLNYHEIHSSSDYHIKSAYTWNRKKSCLMKRLKFWTHKCKNKVNKSMTHENTDKNIYSYPKINMRGVFLKWPAKLGRNTKVLETNLVSNKNIKGLSLKCPPKSHNIKTTSRMGSKLYNKYENICSGDKYVSYKSDEKRRKERIRKEDDAIETSKRKCEVTKTINLDFKSIPKYAITNYNLANNIGKGLRAPRSKPNALRLVANASPGIRFFKNDNEIHITKLHDKFNYNKIQCGNKIRSKDIKITKTTKQMINYDNTNNGDSSLSKINKDTSHFNHTIKVDKTTSVCLKYLPKKSNKNHKSEISPCKINMEMLNEVNLNCTNRACMKLQPITFPSTTNLSNSALPINLHNKNNISPRANDLKPLTTTENTLNKNTFKTTHTSVTGQAFESTEKGISNCKLRQLENGTNPKGKRIQINTDVTARPKQIITHNHCCSRNNNISNGIETCHCFTPTKTRSAQCFSQQKMNKNTNTYSKPILGIGEQHSESNKGKTKSSTETGKTLSGKKILKLETNKINDVIVCVLQNMSPAKVNIHVNDKCATIQFVNEDIKKLKNEKVLKKRSEKKKEKKKIISRKENKTVKKKFMNMFKRRKHKSRFLFAKDFIKHKIQYIMLPFQYLKSKCISEKPVKRDRMDLSLFPQDKKPSFLTFNFPHITCFAVFSKLFIHALLFTIGLIAWCPLFIIMLFCRYCFCCKW